MNDSSHPHYADGQPIQNGDAVLVQGLYGARVEMSIPGVRPTVVVEMAHGSRRLKLYQGPNTERLVLVERRSGDFVRATFEWLSQRAASGEVKAQYGVGYAHQFGLGAAIDPARAAEWFTKAASKGDAEAQASLGAMYSTGDGVRRDEVKAVEWYRKAAEQGESTAQYGLARAYQEGLGVPVDYVQCVRWYRAAADQGLTVAMCNLADKYEHGMGVEQDFAKAYELYMKSARSGVAAAMVGLSGLYKDGHGVERNAEQATKWARDAVRAGWPGKELLDVLHPEKPLQLSESQRAALASHHQLWVQRAQRTASIEPAKIVPAIAALYRAAQLPTPRVVIVPSPIVMIFAGCIASYILDKEKADPGYRSRISLPEQPEGGPARETVRAIAMAIRNGDSASVADVSIDPFEATFLATYHPADVASANAMDAAVIREIQQSFDPDPLMALYNAVHEPLQDPFGNSSFTKRLSAEVDEWGRPLARAIFGGDEEADAAVKTVCDWFRHVRGGNSGAYWEYNLTAARDVVGLKLAEFAAYEPWEACAIRGSFRFMHEKFCMVCDFPAEIGGKAAYRWRDGWSV
jgi:TPR repeat protein